MPKVVHICPTYFDPNSVVAGAERYSYSLAKAMSSLTETRLITFGTSEFVHQDEKLVIRCFKQLFDLGGNRMNPFSIGYLPEVAAADVIHCHQFLTVTTDFAVMLGTL